MRLAISTGSTVGLDVVADWTLNVVSADLSGVVNVVLPGADAGRNRPDKVHVVYYPGNPPAGIDAAALLAAGPSGVSDTPGAGILGNDVTVTVHVPLPLPAGHVTVVAVGEFSN